MFKRVQALLMSVIKVCDVEISVMFYQINIENKIDVCYICHFVLVIIEPTRFM